MQNVPVIPKAGGSQARIPGFSVDADAKLSETPRLTLKSGAPQGPQTF